MKRIILVAGLFIAMKAHAQVNTNTYQNNYLQQLNQPAQRSDTGIRIIDQNRSMNYNNNPATQQPPYNPQLPPPDSLQYRKP